LNEPKRAGKYARFERERRFLVQDLPDGITQGRGWLILTLCIGASVAMPSSAAISARISVAVTLAKALTENLWRSGRPA
jgi:hypothetical protein